MCSRYKVAPRCLLPLGNHCFDETQALQMYGNENTDRAKTKATELYEKYRKPARDLADYSLHKESNVEGYTSIDTCLVANVLVVPQDTKILWEFSRTWVIGPIPVTVEIKVGVNYQMVMAVLLCIPDKAILVNLEPTAGAELTLFGGSSAGFFKVGLLATFWVLRATLSAETSFSVKDGFQLCRALDISILPFKMKVEFVLEFLKCPKIEIVRGSMCTGRCVLISYAGMDLVAEGGNCVWGKNQYVANC